ncbi:G-type lectin S-receptor-like serine/threonine-protein kinase [Dorcoceras hygrometricum]|uniref:G-type lectin S-receptor-like serine/threonine-protein kinase n=1 Tax=Dorcoceras hygrometricum TaxID=472368 RepID=A0A2Z7CSI4_9LAMI|nr:G-type lectin S-receptor-like serine/threonine-protein kinase [Dorcoceras hygrometricum]
MRAAVYALQRCACLEAKQVTPVTLISLLPCYLDLCVPGACLEAKQVFQVNQLVVELTQLEVPQPDNISNHDMHEGAKEKSEIKANNSAGKSEEPQHHAQLISRWKSSIRDLQVRQSSDHQSSVVFRRDNSAGHHLDDIIGPFRHDNLTDQSQR